jgi:formyl-CoA transferase
VSHRQELATIVEDITRGLGTAELTRRLGQAQIAWARMNSMQDFVMHPQLTARDRWRNVETPAGTVRTLAPPVTMDDESATYRPVPSLGQHTDSILRELGFSDQAISAWRTEGTI